MLSDHGGGELAIRGVVDQAGRHEGHAALQAAHDPDLVGCQLGAAAVADGKHDVDVAGEWASTATTHAEAGKCGGAGFLAAGNRVASALEPGRGLLDCPVVGSDDEHGRQRRPGVGAMV